MQFHVAGHVGQGRRELIHQHLARLAQVVYVGVVAVTGVGQLLHQALVVVVHAKTQGGQRDAALALIGSQLLEAVEVADADVEVTIGGQQDAIDAAFDQVLARLLVGQLDARLPCRRTTGAELIDGRTDLRLVAAGRGIEHHLAVTGIGDQRDAILRAQLLDQQFQGALHHRQAFTAMHRAGHIHQEYQVGRRQLLNAAIRRLDGDAQQARLRIPRRHRQFSADAERRIALRQRVGVGKVVDQFLQTHGVLRWQLPAIEEAPHVGVATGINIDAEGGHRRLGDSENRVIGVGLILLARFVTVARRQDIGDGRRCVSQGRQTLVASLGTHLGRCGRSQALAYER